MEKKKVKQSIIAGALTGSAGIFITKALSLLYVIPFNEIAQDATVFYSYAYTVYDSMLQICLSGIPYAIATLVAKYYTKDDIATVKVVKKVSKSLLLVLGVVCCLFMLLFADSLALRIIPTELQATDYIAKTVTVLRIVSFALIFVPILSYYRGFYQGLKEMKVYAFTQVFEQLVRICFLLGMSCFFVYALNFDRIWAAYMGVASTSVSAIATIIYFIAFDRKYELDSDIKEKSIFSNFDILKELINTAVPYLLSSVMLASSGMFVLLMFARGLELNGTDPKLITIYQGIINYQGAKLISIPQIFMSGFCIAIIPHITECITNNDIPGVQNNIQKIILTVNYLTVPVICCMIIFSKEIYYVMYGNYNLEIGANILAKLLFCQLFTNIYGVLQSSLIAMRQRHTYIKLEALRLIIMICIFTPCLKHLGLNGYFVALVLELIIFDIGGFIILKYSIDFDFKQLFNSATKSWIGCLPLFIIAAIFTRLNYNVADSSRIVIMLITGLICAIGLLGYLFITYKNGIFTDIFGITLDKNTLNRLLGRFKKNKEM